MRKNWTMRVGASLLALTLITSCFVGGTWAKYTTSGTGTDSARVAKFGVTVTGKGNAFANKYDSAENATVIGEGDAKVVAPGTGGKLAGVTITGTPEVKVAITYEGEFTLGDGWLYKANGDDTGTYY